MKDSSGLATVFFKELTLVHVLACSDSGIKEFVIVDCKSLSGVKFRFQIQFGLVFAHNTRSRSLEVLSYHRKSFAIVKVKITRRFCETRNEEVSSSYLKKKKRNFKYVLVNITRVSCNPN